MTFDEAALLLETHKINYRLRSTFFYRKLQEYNTLSLLTKVAELLNVEELYNWDAFQQWNIGEDAFQYVVSHPQLHLIEVFCHPKLIREQPALVAYYRNIAALSQKSVSYLAKVNVKNFEMPAPTAKPLREDQALALAKLFNEHISLILDSSIQTLSSDELKGLLLTSTGAQIDGSWRNAIGEEAEKVVQRLLVNEAKENGLLSAFLPRAGTGVTRYDPASIQDLLSRIHEFRGVMLSNQTSILFSSDPDIALVSKSGETTCAIEVKGGSDPAGALERYGAAKKSFEQARRIAPNVPTILLASCITAEVHARIDRDPLIDHYYNLTGLLEDRSQLYADFMSEVFAILNAV